MITVQREDFFIIYILAAFLIIFILWIRELLRVKTYEWALSEGSVCLCDKCRFAFLVKPGESLSNCPRCDELCVVKKYRK
jgi:hypothetical protein